MGASSFVIAVFAIFSGEAGDELKAVEFAVWTTILLGGFRIGCGVACKLVVPSVPFG